MDRGDGREAAGEDSSGGGMSIDYLLDIAVLLGILAMVGIWITRGWRP